ncbi:hypothetical protein BHM03_00059405, partial [Ensete ventricosum]
YGINIFICRGKSMHIDFPQSHIGVSHVPYRYRQYVGIYRYGLVLKPITRQKLRIEGESYQKVLSEFLQNVPAFLGGDCTCSNCENLVAEWPSSGMAETRIRPCRDVSEEDESAGDDYATHHELAFSGNNCDHVLRAAIVAFLMLCVLVAFLSGMYDPESLPSPP